MYLFTRTAHLKAGNPTAGMTFASEVSHKVRELTNHPIQVWASMYSPGLGTVVWSSWFESLSDLERVSDKLTTDGPYLQMLATSAGLFEGTIDDALMEPVIGAPDPSRSYQYVSAVSAVPAAGSFIEAYTQGTAIAERASAVTGHQTMFMRSLTGSYGAVAWLTGFESIEELEISEAALTADSQWTELVDSVSSCFQDDPEATRQIIFRRAG
ncbi:MAG TPA: hypothetical protein VL068_01410 [Microthrixaceae bacterium]|nr:hypothetical protein [Microthrixaceae bacterium]